VTADGSESRIVQNVTAVNGFAYGVIGADIHVFANGLPLYLLANWRREQSQSPGWLRELPSRMLNGRRAVVAFTGREDELAELRRWRDGGPQLAVRWLYGPGGQGKTRLAARLEAESASAGWKVVAAFHGPDADRPEPGSQDMHLANAAGLLMIVDYADRWRLTNLTWLFNNALLHHANVATRVLMIARTADPWPAVRGILETHQAGTSSQNLPGLGQQSSERRDMFTAARDSFAAIYQLSDAEGVGPPGPLDDPQFGLTLAVHMAALVAVDACATGQRPPSDMAGLTIYLLDREQLHWARLYADGTAATTGESLYRTPPELMNQTVFTAALTGTVSPSIGAALLGNLHLPHPEQVLIDHAACYPSTDPGQATVLEPLYPDRLAEDFLALTMPGHHADYPAQAWAGPTATSLVARNGDQPAPATPRAITFLASAAYRWPHLSQKYLYPLLLRDPQLAIDAGSAALNAIAALPGITLAVLEAIESRLPDGLHADLDVGIAALTTRLAEHRLTSRNPAVRSRTLRELAVALTRAGMYQQALAAAQEAVDLKRWLARANPSLHEYNLASTLEDLGSILSNLNRHEEAVAATQEAMDIRRRLAHPGPVALAGQPFTSAKPEAHDTGGAVSLPDSRTWLSKLALKVKGVVWEATAEAAEFRRLRARPDRDAATRRSVTIENPDRQQAALATSLTHQARTLWNAGRLGEALPLAHEAVDIRRRLPMAEPYGQETGLAFSLMNLGILLSELGGREGEALAATEEAAQIYRRLAQADPAAHQKGLAVSLSSLGARLDEAGRQEEALATTAEAVEICRRLVKANPAAHEPLLAGSLLGLGARLAEARRQEEALATAAEAVEIYRRLARADATVHAPDLAVSLDCFGTLLLGSGRPAEALAAAAEAVKVNPGFAQAVGTRGQAYRALGRYEDAVADLTRAIELDPGLAWAIAERDETYLQMGRHEDAAVDLDRAVELDPESAAAVGARGQAYRALGRYEDAVADLTRAIELDPGLAWAIAERGKAYLQMGRHEDAMSDLNRAIELAPESVAAVGTRGQVYQALGRYDSALADLNRAIELYPDSAPVLRNRGQVYQALGRYDSALADLNRAIELDPELAWPIAERGETYRLMGRYQDAVTDLTRAVELDPEYGAAVGTRGQVYRALGNYQEAVTDLNRAIELNPELAWAIAERGETYRLMGRHKDAAVDLARAAELDRE
jgi:tetratricopeptide (TPR) repeat protein